MAQTPSLEKLLMVLPDPVPASRIKRGLFMGARTLVPYRDLTTSCRADNLSNSFLLFSFRIGYISSKGRFSLKSTQSFILAIIKGNPYLRLES
jgi:hypothetical protein